jgi:hypothetical protein
MVGSALLAGSKKLSSFVCPPFVIPPFFYGLLAADTAIASVYPAIADRSKIGVLGRTSLDLSNDSASIVLRNTNESTIDSVRYYKSWQTSLRPDLTGISLERIHWYGPSNEASNWQSSNDARGATPLAANSTTLGSTPPSQNVAFNASFDPNPFSPDGDGFEDIATLTITSGDANQYAVRVRVFDNNGRVVRTLADAATMTGSLPLYFDGKRDNGQTLVPGLYTVLVELSSQNSTSLRKTIGIGIAGKRR